MLSINWPTNCVMHLSLLCPTFPGWWWVGIMKDVCHQPHALLGRVFALYGDLLLYIHTFVWYWFDERDSPVQIPYYAAPPLTNLGEWGKTDSCIRAHNALVSQAKLVWSGDETKQTSKQAYKCMHVRNVVMLVWGSLWLAPNIGTTWNLV